MRIAVVARNIGLVLLLNALFMLIAVVVSMLYGFDKGFTPLLFSAAITAIIGSLPFVFTRKQEEITIREGYVIAVFSWLFSCLFGMIP
ncbi:MAG TPA: TrkH family potassium uptake protein, partial [Bacteroidales bacterium]|nr:TrkH family potassium uptake protein [Bacteroidales bacterium]